MNKQIIEEDLFHKSYEGVRRYIALSEIPEEFLKPEYFIDIEKEETYYGSDHGNEAYTDVRIFRKREQTDEEFETYKRFWEEKNKESLQERKKQYERLKKEFENE